MNIIFLLFPLLSLSQPLCLLPAIPSLISEPVFSRPRPCDLLTIWTGISQSPCHTACEYMTMGPCWAPLLDREFIWLTARASLSSETRAPRTGRGREQALRKFCHSPLQARTHLIGHPAVGARIPGNQVLHQLLDPAALFGAQVLCRQAHVPVGAGAHHGQEGHQVARPVH